MQGDSDMTDHHTSRRIRDDSRHVAIRDLRFAGTIAAGLCAGVLGIGALAAPLVGWDQWPDALNPKTEGSLTVNQPPAPTSPIGSPGYQPDSAAPGAPALPDGTGTALAFTAPGADGSGCLLYTSPSPRDRS